MTKLLDQQLKSYRIQVDEIVKELHQLTLDINHQTLATTVSDLRNRINEPFMFVIVGEVKTGKSSFINALLGTGKEICKVAPSPMTDTIQQILYAETEEIIQINPYFVKIFQPVEILKEIAIVDTPGTNTIIEHHQEITERFIPASDLIVFVFEAKNPYRQSAWDFFDFIHKDWHKKIIFVLQQKDLLPPEDLATNFKGVEEYAVKKGIAEPKVFAVSAKQELEGHTEDSGFSVIKEYIADNITGGKAPVLKLQNNINTSQQINHRIQQGLELRQRQWEADTAFRADIKDTLEQQALKSNSQVEILIENLLAAFDRITRDTENELAGGLSFFSLLRRSLGGIFSKKASPKEWLGNLASTMELKMKNELKTKLDNGVIDIADSIQQMAKMIDLKLKNSATILKDNHEIFSDIAEKRANVLRELQESFSNFLTRSENFADEELFEKQDNLSPSVATGSGIAIVGVILTAVTNGMVFDITGGILTTLGLLFAGVSVGLQRRKILRAYRQEIEKGRDEMQREVDQTLKNYIHKIKERIDANFVSFDELLANEAVQIKQLYDRHAEIARRLQELETALAP